MRRLGNSEQNMLTLWTTDEAAKVLRMSARTLERRRLDGTGPKFVKLGGRVLYRPECVSAWADDRTFASTAEAQATA
jgi:hypothetical protein